MTIPTKTDADNALELLSHWETEPGELHPKAAAVIEFVSKVRQILPETKVEESLQQAAERGYGPGARMKNK